MQRAESWSEEHTGRVVHLVGRVTDKVIGFLGPAVDALAESGVDQVVVLVDDLRYRNVLPRLHDSVQLVLTPAARNPVRRWRWALEAFREVLRSGPVKVVQLHGFLPCLMGLWVARTTGIAAPMHYSPNGSESIGQVSSFAELLRWTLAPARNRRAHRSAPLQTAAGEPGERAPADVRPDTIESPLEAAFFAVGRNESRHPLVVAGNRVNDPRCSELLAQLAVLLSGEALELAFNWVGAVDHGSRMRLKAANVGVFDVRTAADRASRLAAGWVYLAPGGAGEFPVHLVEAMAVGLPCVALDTPYHREVITHGVTGYLCRTEHEIVRCIAELIDSSALRMQIGQAAREEARGRFSEAKFRDSLFAAYDLPVKTRTEIQP
jgi:glycosyltransferase involved in cell wall biosynthesis